MLAACMHLVILPALRNGIADRYASSNTYLMRYAKGQGLEPGQGLGLGQGMKLKKNEIYREADTGNGGVDLEEEDGACCLCDCRSPLRNPSLYPISLTPFSSLLSPPFSPLPSHPISSLRFLFV